MTTTRLEELRESFTKGAVMMRFSNFFQAADPDAKINVVKKCHAETAELFTYIDTCRASCAELITSVTTLSTALRDQGTEMQALRAKAEAYDAAHRYALNLVTEMAKDYPAVPEWQPLEDVTGMLMQIDNMGAGRSAKAKAGKLDTARLDRVIALLGADALTLMPSQKDNGNMLLCPVYEGIVNKKFSEGKTAREAIDAAMKETNV